MVKKIFILLSIIAILVLTSTCNKIKRTEGLDGAGTESGYIPSGLKPKAALKANPISKEAKAVLLHNKDLDAAGRGDAVPKKNIIAENALRIGEIEEVGKLKASKYDKKTDSGSLIRDDKYVDKKITSDSDGRKFDTSSKTNGKTLSEVTDASILNSNKIFDGKNFDLGVGVLDGRRRNVGWNN